ncbi:MAG TPA: cupredoxin family copper-binding protein [Solirubrobacterales bacterium]
MKGARALASGMLVLALSCAIPAISVAQDAGTTTDATTTTTATVPDPAVPPPDPGADSGNDPGTQNGGKGKPANTGQDMSTPAPAPVPAEPADAASGGGSSAPTPKAQKSASASVTMGDLFFSPTSVTIAVGDTVTWNNTGQAPHNATADDGSFKTPDLNNGQSASHTFAQAGTFSYICTIHPNMKGTVRVLSSGGGGGGGGGGSSSSSGSASSEASAVASPGAAGDSNTLPMTGMAVGGLALVGFGLLALGLIARQADRERPRLRWFSIF